MGKIKLLGKDRLPVKNNNPNNSAVSMNKSKLSTQGCIQSILRERSRTEDSLL